MTDGIAIYVVTATNEHGAEVRYATDDLRVANLATEVLKQRGVATGARVGWSAVVLNDDLPTFLRAAEEITLSPDTRARRVIEESLTRTTERLNEIVPKLRAGSQEHRVIEQAYECWSDLKRMRRKLSNESDPLDATIAQIEEWVANAMKEAP